MADELTPNPQDPPVIDPVEDKPVVDPKVAKLEQEKEYWKGVADGRAFTAPVAQPAPVVPQPPVDPEPTVEPEPRFEDFADPGKFYSAQTKHLASQQKHEAWKDRQERKQQDERERAQRTESEKAQRAMSDFEKRLADEAKVDPAIYTIRDQVGSRVVPHTARLIIESEHGPRLIRHFAENPAELARLNSLDQASAIREMTKLELNLTKGLEDATGKVKTVSSTPNPLETVGGGGPNTGVEDPRDPDSSGRMDPDNWIYKRNMQVAGMVDQARAARSAQR